MKREEFDRLNTIAEWYQALPSGHNDLQGVMDARRDLSVLAFKLAAYVGQLSRESQAAEARRKIKFCVVREEEIRGGASVSAATSKAEAAAVELKAQEADAGGRYSYGRVLYDSVSNVLNSMAGEINFLMRELSTVSHREN